MKLVYQYMAIFFTFLNTSNHLNPLQVENCGSNSRLVVDEDDNGKFRPERVNTATVLFRVWRHPDTRIFCFLRKYNNYAYTVLPPCWGSPSSLALSGCTIPWFISVGFVLSIYLCADHKWQIDQLLSPWGRPRSPSQCQSSPTGETGVVYDFLWDISTRPKLLCFGHEVIRMAKLHRAVILKQCDRTVWLYVWQKRMAMLSCRFLQQVCDFVGSRPYWYWAIPTLL